MVCFLIRIAKAKSSVNTAFGPDYVSSPSLPKQRKQWLAFSDWR
jgi:hypothetical protein